MSTRAIQITELLTPVIDYRDGAVAASFTVEFYAAGTSDTKNVWTEKEKTNAYTTRTLSSDGTVQVYGDGIYKIIIKDTTPTTVYTWDNMKYQATTYTVQNKSGAYTVTPDDDLIIVDTDVEDITISAEAVATFERGVTIFNAGSNDVIFNPDGSETVGGELTYYVYSGSDAVTFLPDVSGGLWKIGSSGAIVNDLDGDTKIQVEESSDDDTIRFDCEGAEVESMSIYGTTSGGVVSRDAISSAGTNFGGKMETVCYSQEYNVGGATDNIKQFAAGTMILGVTARVTEAIVGCTTIDIGIEGGDTDLFVDGMSVDITTVAGPGNANNPELLPHSMASTAYVMLTAVGGDANMSAGKLRMDFYYRVFTGPTS